MCGILILCAMCEWKPGCIARKMEDLTDLMDLWWVTRETCNPTLQVAITHGQHICWVSTKNE